MAGDYLYLDLLLRNNLSLVPGDYALSSHGGRGVECDFLGMQLSTVFQPIFRTDGRVIGHEALLRAYTSTQHELLPEAAFERAIHENRLVQFDRLVRTIHLLNHARSFAEDERLFLNVHPQLLVSVQEHGRIFEQILHYYSVPTSRVVIEIKAAAVANDETLQQAVANYRALGYQIAVDDFGVTQSSLNRLRSGRGGYSTLVSDADNAELDRVLKLRPDIVKLDGTILRQSSGAIGVIYGLVDSFQRIGTQVLIEGIETSAQLEIARNSGADLLQGNVLAGPCHVPQPAAIELSSRIDNVAPSQETRHARVDWGLIRYLQPRPLI